jgi:hypothetical protein
MHAEQGHFAPVIPGPVSGDASGDGVCPVVNAERTNRINRAAGTMVAGMVVVGGNANNYIESLIVTNPRRSKIVSELNVRSFI